MLTLEGLDLFFGLVETNLVGMEWVIKQRWMTRPRAWFFTSMNGFSDAKVCEWMHATCSNIDSPHKHKTMHLICSEWQFNKLIFGGWDFAHTQSVENRLNLAQVTHENNFFCLRLFDSSINWWQVAYWAFSPLVHATLMLWSSHFIQSLLGLLLTGFDVDITLHYIFHTFTQPCTGIRIKIR